MAEEQIAEMLGVSRVPVREALAELERTGMIRASPQGKRYVAEVTHRDFMEMREVRTILERYAVRCLAASWSPKAASLLGAIIERMRVQQAEGMNIAATSVLDEQFHRTIWALAGNRQLAKTLDSLSGVMLLYIYSITLRDSTHEEVILRHQTLLQALATGDPDTAEAAIVVHIVSQ